MAETKAAFRRRVARLLRIITEVTTSGTGTSTTQIAASLIDYFANDNDLNGAWSYDVAASEQRRVSDYEAATGTITVSRAYTNSQAASRAVEVYRGFAPSEIDEALREALTAVYPYIAAMIVDTSTTVVAGTYTYTVPSTIRDLERMMGGKVEVEWDTTNSTRPYREVPRWDTRKIRLAAGTESYTLQLHTIDGMSGKTLRITGLGHLTFPTTDAASLYLDEDGLYLLALKTAALVYKRHQYNDNTDRARGEDRANEFEAEYERLKDRFGDKLVPAHLNDPTFAGFPRGELAENSTPSA